jgi:S-layer protein
VSGTDKLVLCDTGVAYVAAVLNVTETASVAFSALTSGQTVTVEGITVTAPAGGLTQAEVAAQFASLAASATPAGIVTGTFTTAGSLVGWTKGAASTNTVLFTDANTVAGTDVTDLAASGTNSGTAVSIGSITQGTGSTRESVVSSSLFSSFLLCLDLLLLNIDVFSFFDLSNP